MVFFLFRLFNTVNQVAFVPERQSVPVRECFLQAGKRLHATGFAPVLTGERVSAKTLNN